MTFKYGSKYCGIGVGASSLRQNHHYEHSGARMSRWLAVYEIGDSVLFALSAWGQCSWQKFRRTFDDLHLQSLSVSGQVAVPPGANVRLNAARTLDSLGHCEVVFGADGDVLVAPSVLAAEPVAGLPRAVLGGSRSPDTLTVSRR